MTLLNTNTTRRGLLRAGVALSAATAGFPALSNTPSGPMKLIVGFAAGGSADAVARATAAGLQAETGRTVVVENRPGGQLKISLQALTRSAPDGNTLVYMTGTYLAIQATQRLFDVDSVTTAITNTISTPIVLLVRADSPFRTVADMVAAARRGVDKVSYGVITRGGTEHFKMTQLERTAGFKGLLVPYNSGADGIKGVLGGDIDFMPVPGIFARTFAGKLRPLAVLGEQRWQQLPDVPTLRESGFQVPPTSYWGGWSAPAGMNAEDAARLAQLLGKVSQQPSVLAQLQATGHDLQLSESPLQFRNYIRAELAWMSELAEREGLVAK